MIQKGRVSDDSEDNLGQVGRTDPSASSEVAFLPARRVGTPPNDRRQSRSPSPSNDGLQVKSRQFSTPINEDVSQIQIGTSSLSQTAIAGKTCQKSKEPRVRFKSLPSYDTDCDYYDDEVEEYEQSMSDPEVYLNASEAAFRQFVVKKIEENEKHLRHVVLQHKNILDISDEQNQQFTELKQDLNEMGHYVRRTFDDVNSMVSDRICQSRETLNQQLSTEMAVLSEEINEIKGTMFMITVPLNMRVIEKGDIFSVERLWCRETAGF